MPKKIAVHFTALKKTLLCAYTEATFIRCETATADYRKSLSGAEVVIPRERPQEGGDVVLQRTHQGVVTHPTLGRN